MREWAYKVAFMIVDSSVIVAIFFQEPGYERLIDRLADAAAKLAGRPLLFVDDDFTQTDLLLA